MRFLEINRCMNIIELKDQFIDVGASDREGVEKMGIRIGDPIVFEGDYQLLGEEGLVVSRCFDDKDGSFIVNEIIRKLQDSKLSVAVHGVSTVQEEIGDWPVTHPAEPERVVAGRSKNHFPY